MRYIVFFILCGNMIQAQNIEKDLVKDAKKEYCFEYREPYFTKNFDAQFRIENKTHTLEENWGLWGHNISRFINVNESMFSIINGKMNSDQFCFSSPQLALALEKAIKIKVKSAPKNTKFMVMPNDNYLVCQCNKCKSIGNTQTNASPAVFTLLNKLAKKFPKKEFFSTAYITVQKAPSFKLNANVGVMISTMAFPKGVVIQESKNLKVVTNVIQRWKKRTKKIYLWDYAINFDNYFEFYPTVLITQKNIQYYKKQGVSGIFMQGNENGYAAFGDLKCYLYAQLLQDSNIEIKAYIKQYLEANYPSVSTILYNYYIKIEVAALKSKYPLHIYGGMQQAYKKYLNKEDFENFYKELQQKVKIAPIKEQQKIAPLMMALTFQWLEIKRTTTEIKKEVINKQCKAKIKDLSKLQKETNIDTYSETERKLTAYYTYWNKEIFSKKQCNIFKNKKFKILSKLDEDYPKSNMLNDGLVGFSDYYNNWLLATEDNIKIQIEVAEVKKAKTVELSFLNDKKHKIYLPEYVVVSIDKKVTKVKIEQNGKNKSNIKIKLNLKTTSKQITIEAFKQKKLKKNTIACDEIIFN